MRLASGRARSIAVRAARESLCGAAHSLHRVVAELRLQLGRADEIGEQDGGDCGLPHELGYQIERTGYCTIKGSGLSTTRLWTMAWQTNMRSKGSL
jgi:hypothetical protein